MVAPMPLQFFSMARRKGRDTDSTLGGKTGNILSGQKIYRSYPTLSIRIGQINHYYLMSTRSDDYWPALSSDHEHSPGNL